MGPCGLLVLKVFTLTSQAPAISRVSPLLTLYPPKFWPSPSLLTLGPG